MTGIMLRQRQIVINRSSCVYEYDDTVYYRLLIIFHRVWKKKNKKKKKVEKNK